jgi:NifU-like protein involved in Fe-S cluster formation
VSLGAGAVDYNDEVIRRFEALPHAGPPPEGPGLCLRGMAGSPDEGAQVAFLARVQEGRLVALGFEAFACPHILAACSIAAERLTGQELGALAAFDPLALCVELGVPPEKSSRLMIVQDALRNCLADWDNRQLREPPRT